MSITTSEPKAMYTRLDPAACRPFEHNAPIRPFPRAGLRKRTDGRWQLMIWDADGHSQNRLEMVSWRHPIDALDWVARYLICLHEFQRMNRDRNISRELQALADHMAGSVLTMVGSHD